MQTVAIVGRPNVGKSTLFNRVTEKPTAIVDNQPGITRDRIYDEADWNGKKFRVIDTGGLLIRPNDIFEKEIKRQVELATEEADCIIFVVDVLTSTTQQDLDIAERLRRQTKPVIVAVNKVDNDARRSEVYVFHELGFEHMVGISSINGQGTGELLDLVTQLLPQQPQEEDLEESTIPKIAILGQPNVGKSTLTNMLLGEERTLVTPIAGTTRDAIHSHYNLYGKELILIDTAGLRRKDRSKENVEFYSAIRTVKALDHADVAMILFDVSQPSFFTAQDLNIFVLAKRKGKGIVLLANKWDQIEGKENNTSKEIQQYIERKIAPFTDVPIIFISALNKQRISKALETTLEVYERRMQKIGTHKLNDWLAEAVAKFPPFISRGRSLKIKYMTQLPTIVPSFALFCNYPDEVSGSYKQYLENQLRANFNFHGVPIRLYFRNK